MSGHSKWAQIKRKKAVTDSKRGALFAKISKEIMVAVKLGGHDPQANFRLRFAIEKAKINLVPANNIQRAIEKASGKNDDENIEEIIYEGFGPNGTAFLICAMTDNRNRTVKDLRTYFTKCNGHLAQSGAVSWMFKKCGEIKLPLDKFSDKDKIYEVAIEAGANDVEFFEDTIILITEFEELEKVVKNLTTMNTPIQESRIIYKPNEIIHIEDVELVNNLVKLLDLIEEHDDIQNVFFNFDFSETSLDKLE